MRRTILLASGIWPPAIGGPASHAPELGSYLVARGHPVEAFTIAGPDAVLPPFRLHRTPPDGPRWLRIPRGGLRLVGPVHRAGVVYATGMYHRAALVSRLAGTPLVIKLVADPAYERARGLGLFEGSLDAFQAPQRDPRLRALKAARDAVAATAARLITPSEYLAAIVERWRGSADVEVIPNPPPSVGRVPARDVARRQLGFEGPTLVFAGRLVPQKNLPLLVAATARAAPGLRLVVVGDGPEAARVRAEVARHRLGERVRMVPAQPRDEVLTYLRAADAVVLSSDWENHPHAAVEALAVGTPVASTAVGGVAEIVEHRRTGLLVDPGDAAALAEAMTQIVKPEVRAGLCATIARTRRDVDDRGFARIAVVLEDLLDCG